MCDTRSTSSMPHPLPFLTTLLLALATTLHAVEPLKAFTPGARILFQGDSITDGNRGRSADPNHILGHGYAFIIAAVTAVFLLFAKTMSLLGFKRFTPNNF